MPQHVAGFEHGFLRISRGRMMDGSARQRPAAPGRAAPGGWGRGGRESADGSVGRQGRGGDRRRERHRAGLLRAVRRRSAPTSWSRTSSTKRAWTPSPPSRNAAAAPPTCTPTRAAPPTTRRSCSTPSTCSGSLDVLVTAAGISTADYRSDKPQAVARRAAKHARDQPDPMRRFTELRLGDWQKVLDVNLTGTLLAVQAAARVMLDLKKRGSIITIASIAAKHPEAGAPAYSVSKAGVWMLTKYAARVLGPAGIRVNAIGPGFIETNMTAVVRGLPDLEERLLADVPLGRMGTAREVADAALFLAGQQSSYFTGEMLHPDGGFYTD
ncbi:SDR family oxidoreductase [Yinghuangia aomiensis]